MDGRRAPTQLGLTGIRYSRRRQWTPVQSIRSISSLIAVLAPKVLDRGAAVRKAEVVDDQVAADGEPRVEVDEPVHRRLVQVAVEAHHRPSVVADGGEAVLEPALEEADAVVEQAEAPKVALHLLERDGELLGGVVQVSGVGRIGVLARVAGRLGTSPRATPTGRGRRTPRQLRA